METESLESSMGCKVRDFAKKAYGIDFAGPSPPLNENIVDGTEICLENKHARSILIKEYIEQTGMLVKLFNNGRQ